MKLENITLEAIYANCEEVGDCMEWQGMLANTNNSPLLHVDGVGKRSVRRVVVEIDTGKPLSQALRCRMKCTNSLCVRREHIQALTYRQMGALGSKLGWQSHPAVKAAIARGRRNRPDVKLSMEKAREIRASELSGPKLAAIYGVNRSLIAAIKRGEAWREGVQGASVFSL